MCCWRARYGSPREPIHISSCKNGRATVMEAEDWRVSSNHRIVLDQYKKKKIIRGYWWKCDSGISGHVVCLRLVGGDTATRDGSPVYVNVSMSVSLPHALVSRLLRRLTYTFKQSCWHKTKPLRDKVQHIHCLITEFLHKARPTETNNGRCGSGAAAKCFNKESIWTRTRYTLCFLAESFPFFLLSLQLLPLAYFHPKWVKQ